MPVPQAYHFSQFSSPPRSMTPYEHNSLVLRGTVPYEAIGSPFPPGPENPFQTHPNYCIQTPPRYHPPNSSYIGIPNPSQSNEIGNTYRMPMTGASSPGVASHPYRSNMVESSPIYGTRPSSYVDNFNGTYPSGNWRFPN